MRQPRWIKLKSFCEMAGITRRSAYGLMERGRWMLSREYKKVNGRYYVNIEAYERWIENNG